MQDLTPAITTTANTLIDAVLALALGDLPGKTMFIGMRDHADNTVAAAEQLRELLEIQTQGGCGPAEDDYTAADPVIVAQTLRTHLLTRLADKTGLTLTATVAA
ncbi:hypothetical protein ACWIGW_44215 [Nocardia brasiliensis]